MDTLINTFKNAVYSLEQIPQRKDYHPEGSVLTHEAIVWHRVKEEFFKDEDKSILATMQAAALFHDIGKRDTLDFHKKKGYPTTYNHDFVSSKYVDAIGDLFVPKGYKDLLHYIVRYHMDIKFKNDQSEMKRVGSKVHDRAFEFLKLFNRADNMLTTNIHKNDVQTQNIRTSFMHYVDQCLKGMEISLFMEIVPEAILGHNGALLMLRGVPGSGKSLLAEYTDAQVVSADMYFLDDEGNYNFNKSELGKAHTYCRDSVRTFMEDKHPFIVVTNTSTQEWEMLHYMRMANKYSYRFFSSVVENRHGNENTHGVSDSKVAKMKKRFQISL